MMNSSNTSGSARMPIRATLVPQEEPRPHNEQQANTPQQQQQANVLQVLESNSDNVVSVENEDIFLKGEPQPLEYRDRAFAVAFGVQVVAIIVTAVVLSGVNDGFNNKDDDASTEDNDDANSSSSSWTPLWIWFVTSCLCAVGATALGLFILMRYSSHMIHISFFAAPLFLLAIAVWTALDPQLRGEDDGLPFFYLAMAAFLGCLSTCYYLCFKRYMPFAAANLRTALSAIRAHKGLLLVSLANGVVSFVWMVVWWTALLGVFRYVGTHNPQVRCVSQDGTSRQTDYDPNNDGMCDATPNGIVVFAFLFSFYWTHQVLQNVLHVTTAGTVGTWWFTTTSAEEEESLSFCSGFQDVFHSLCRALTYSFGSICLGSLLVAILQTLESMVRSARRHRRGSGALLLCVLECLVHLLRRWMEYFNSWAMIYVGLYGYDYLTAGKNVVRLFKSTGWTTFIADRLVYRAVMMCHLSIGVLVGGISAGMDGVVGPVFAANPSDKDDRTGSHLLAFFFGALIGMMLSSTVLFVVESAVRTVIVCFAESPGEFQMHHPELCEEMTQGWSETYPDAWATRRNNRPSSTSVPMASARVSNNDEQESVRLV